VDEVPGVGQRLAEPAVAARVLGQPVLEPHHRSRFCIWGPSVDLELEPVAGGHTDRGLVPGHTLSQVRGGCHRPRGSECRRREPRMMFDGATLWASAGCSFER